MKSNSQFSILNSQLLKGQALITLLVFVAVAMIITAGAVTVTIINSQGISKFAQGEEALFIAETGADNAILRILRDPNNTYLSETLSVSDGTATITVSGTTSKTIISEGRSGNFKRKIQVDGSLTGNVFTISAWREID
ncbi:MAG: hypothetical protein HY377_01935 [Candidatus Blackburnbacteria bacterium]|nr:hypothetical protein [Candidatus Blackburnbacteria bacterium]